MATEIVIAHLFPELLNLYADQGNVAVLSRRAAMRGIEVRVRRVRLGEELDAGLVDIILLGGGSDREQAVVGRAMAQYREDLRAAFDKGMPILAVCGGYQLVGKYYELSSGERIEGAGLVDVVTRPGKGRLIGNIAVEWLPETGAEAVRTVVGFENHIGRTEHDYPAFGRVLRGHGNNGRDHREGIQYKGLLGTYIHGPLLPKNPHVADHLLERALLRKGHSGPLSPLDDALEWKAHVRALEIAGVRDSAQRFYEGPVDAARRVSR